MASRHRHRMVRRLSLAALASVSVRTFHSFRHGILDGSKGQSRRHGGVTRPTVTMSCQFWILESRGR
jgi:hypothetical protein